MFIVKKIDHLDYVVIDEKTGKEVSQHFYWMDEAVAEERILNKREADIKRLANKNNDECPF